MSLFTDTVYGHKSRRKLCRKKVSGSQKMDVDSLKNKEGKNK